MKYERGIDACALCRDASGRTLLVPAGLPAPAVTAGEEKWTLPGGSVRHGEHPAAAVARSRLVRPSRWCERSG
jgi:ADP-ribose pyrophosphatase YjhB (NUDIX family)